MNEQHKCQYRWKVRDWFSSATYTCGKPSTQIGINGQHFCTKHYNKCLGGILSCNSWKHKNVNKLKEESNFKPVES